VRVGRLAPGVAGRRPRPAELRVGRVQTAVRLAATAARAREGRRGGRSRAVPPPQHVAHPRCLDVLFQGPLAAMGGRGAVRAFFAAAAAVAGRSSAHTPSRSNPKSTKTTRASRPCWTTLVSTSPLRAQFRHHRHRGPEPPEEGLLVRMRKSMRYGVRKAAREGVEVVEPEDFKAAWNTFYGWRTRPSAS
jgi:hypothetical protein